LSTPSNFAEIRPLLRCSRASLSALHRWAAEPLWERLCGISHGMGVGPKAAERSTDLRCETRNWGARIFHPLFSGPIPLLPGTGRQGRIYRPWRA